MGKIVDLSGGCGDRRSDQVELGPNLRNGSGLLEER